MKVLMYLIECIFYNKCFTTKRKPYYRDGGNLTGPNDSNRMNNLTDKHFDSFNNTLLCFLTWVFPVKLHKPGWTNIRVCLHTTYIVSIYNVFL